MTSNLVFMKDGESIKKPLLLNDEVFLIYAPRKHKFPCSEIIKYDTQLAVSLPGNSWGFF